MKKRILCALLTLILLVGMLPINALTASAAGRSISENAITVVKQLQKYKNTCNVNGITGYGTKCPKGGTHGTHYISEKEADAALRASLKEIDKAVNDFASRNGLSLQQREHDALAVFSVQNGIVWLKGTGDLQSAITKRLTGEDFLNAICRWNASISDDDYRMIEANMYLNGVYSSTVPSRYIRVLFDANGGIMKETGNTSEGYQYFDVKNTRVIGIVPVYDDNIFLGWYKDGGDTTERITKVTSEFHDLKLVANWQIVGENTYEFSIKTSKKLYLHRDTDDDQKIRDYVTGELKFSHDYIDDDSIRWGMLEEAEKYFAHNGKTYDKVRKDYSFAGKNLWVNLGEFDYLVSDDSTVGTGGKLEMDVTVTVTNGFVNYRRNPATTSTLLGKFNLGDKLRIIDTKSNNNHLWGQVAKSAKDATPIGWVALMYTNFDQVRDQDAAADSNVEDNSKIIAKAVVKVAGSGLYGYVNVRNGAGIDNQIVGALSNDTEVDLFEIKYVNGQQWGRCKTGWFCLAYATVTRLVEESTEVTQEGFTSYAFSGNIVSVGAIYDGINGNAIDLDALMTEINEELTEENKKLSDKKKKELLKSTDEIIKDGDNVKLTNITVDEYGCTWGKIVKTGWQTKSKLAWWVSISNNAGDNDNITLDVAKYQVVSDTASVRDGADTNAARLDYLSTGTEFNVTKIIADKTTIWGYADKVGAASGKTYSGWVNLASKYVTRNNGILVDTNPGTTSDQIATITNADKVNVRSKPSIYGGLVGTVTRGTVGEVLDSDNGWYKLKLNGFSGSTWVYRDYVEITEASTSTGNGGTGSDGKILTGTGIVANTYAGVNMRQTPGIGGAFMGKILPGTPVEIRQVQKVGASNWGKVIIDGKTGWICMDYVTMVTYEQYEEIVGGTGNGNGGGSNNTITNAQPAIYTGYIQSGGGSLTGTEVVPDSVRDDVHYEDEILQYIFFRGQYEGKVIVFKSPDIKSDHVRYLEDNDPVTVHEVLTAQEEYYEGSDDNNLGDDIGGASGILRFTFYWARINDGYIRCPGLNIQLNTLDEAVYTLVDHSTLTVYEDVRLTTAHPSDMTLTKGDQVKITQVKIVNGLVSGMIELGDNTPAYINLTKMTKGAIELQSTTVPEPTEPEEEGPVIGDYGNTGTGGFVENASGYKYTGKVVNVVNAPLKARNTPSTGAKINATFNNGANLVIYETTISEGMTWGRCDAGWVYLYYVRMTPAGGSAIDANVIYSENTLIYSDSVNGEVVGTYTKGAVIDIYEKVGNMVRTDKGWVSKGNLLHAC